MGTAAFSRVEQESEWVVAHRTLSRLAKERAAADAEEGRWLLAALRSAVHVHLGFGSFGEYVERCFGHKPRSTQEKLRVAEALEELPVLAGALAKGTLNWSAARELTRVATPETEREWLEVADAKSARQLEELVAGKTPGDTPSSPSQPSERRHVLRFDVAPETFALFREALLALRRSSGRALDDDSALLEMARHVLGGPRDEGRASYQIALTVCAQCGHGYQPSGGELVAVGSDIVAMAHCDGQHLGCVPPHPANDSTFADAHDSSRRAHVGADVHAENDALHARSAATVPAHAQDRQADAHVGADIPAENDALHAHRGATVTAHAEHRRADHVGATFTAHAEHHQADAHVGATGRPHGECRQADAHAGAELPLPPSGDRGLARAKQTTPPALRRAVLARDHRRCRVPGCRNGAFLDVHHIDLRSEGGPNALDNLITLCGAHHRAAHRGRLLVEGTSPTARFHHADGSPYGRVGEPLSLEAQAKTFSALRNLGFREGDVRAVLTRLRDEGELEGATTEQWLRSALRRLTPRRGRL